jgi:hypothetical protein
MNLLKSVGHIAELFFFGIPFWIAARTVIAPKNNGVWGRVPTNTLNLEQTRVRLDAGLFQFCCYI